MPHTQEKTARDLAGQLISFMETGAPPDGLFTQDVFCDFTMPQWRLQAQGIEDLVALRTAGHAGPSSVPRSRFDATTTGFALEVEEQWDADGEPWYCREVAPAGMIRIPIARSGGSSMADAGTTSPGSLHPTVGDAGIRCRSDDDRDRARGLLAAAAGSGWRPGGADRWPIRSFPGLSWPHGRKPTG